MQPFNDIKLLLERYIQGTITPQQEAELADLLEGYSNEELYELLEAIAGRPDDIEADRAEDLSWQEPMLQAIRSHPGFRLSKGSAVGKPFYRLAVFRYAAAVVLIAAITATVVGVLTHHLSDKSYGSVALVVQSPCSLRLPTGTAKDSIVQMRIVNGVVTLSIPNSWQYMLTLSDGTRVWLNASSSITYPFAFSGDSREVQLKGEAYFMVKNNAKPFYVTAKGRKLLAPSSGFNINAYEEQGIASIDTTHNPAWKEGYFAFHHTTMKKAMGELARWYGWKLVYDKDNFTGDITGSFCRTTSEADVLDYLKASKVNFKKQGNQLTIYN